MNAIPRVAVPLLLSLLIAAPAALADRTGEIRGAVVDAAGAPVSGVLVTATSPALQGARKAVSDASGAFRLPLLPVGTYALAFSREGLEAVTLADTAVGLGGAANVRVTLGASVAERIAAAAPLLDATRTDSSLHLTAADLALLPVQGRTIAEVTDLAPGVTGVRVNTDTYLPWALPSFRGEGNDGNNWLVDGLSNRGVDTNDPGPRINYDAWAAVQVVSDGFSPELGQATGGFVNVVTRSGGNQFHGEAGALVRDDQLRARQKEQLSAASLPQASIGQYYGNLGGPILKDRLWFFLSDNFLTNTDETTSQTVGWLEIPPGAHKTTSNNLFGKLTLKPSEGHTLSLGATVDRSVDDTGGTGLPALYTTERFDDRVYRLNYDGVLGPNLTVSFALGQNRRNSSSGPASGDFGPPKYFWEDIAQATNNVDWGSNSLQTRTEAALDAGWALDGGWWGRHELRAGVGYSRMGFSVTMRHTGHDLDPWKGNGFDDGSSVTWTSPGSPQTLVEWMTGDAPGNVAREPWGLGFHLQDTVFLGRLTATIGVRSDTQRVSNDTGRELWSWGVRDLLQPRLALAFDLTGDGRTLVKASYGVFAAPNRFDDLYYFSDYRAYAFRLYGWRGPANPTAAQLADPANWDFVFEQSNSGTAPEVDPALKPNSLRRVLLAFERQLSPSWAAKLRGVLSRTINLHDDVVVYAPDTQSTRYVFTNLAAKRRDYAAVELELNGRVGTTLFLDASYTWSRARGTASGNADESGITPFGDHPYVPPSDPNKELYDFLYHGLGGMGVGDEGWYGYLPYSVDHIVKVFATWSGPWGIKVSPGVTWLSGYHWEKKGWNEAYQSYLTFPEGRGTRTTPSHAYVDLGIRKRFELGMGTSLDLGVSVSNLFNSQRPVSYIKDDTELFGQVWGRQAPRWVQVTVGAAF